MRIMQVIPLLDLAGAETMCENLTNSLIALDNDVIVVSLYDHHSVVTERLEKNGVKIIYLGKKSGLDLSVFTKLIKMFKKYKPDVVHSHIYAGKYAHIAALICRIPGKIYTVHSVARKEAGKINRHLNRFLFKCCNVVPVSLSKEIQKSVMNEYGLDSKKTPIVFNGIPIENCIEKKSYERNTEILHVGRFSPEKNHEALVRAIAILVEKGYDIKLSLYGKGELEKTIKGLVCQLHMENRIRFCGVTDHVYEVMNKHDIFVLPSIYEGMPMTLIEAMGTGLPILASNVGGIPDMIVHEKTGLLCDPSTEKIAEELERLIKSSAERKMYGENAIKRSKMFSANKMAKEYYEIYLTVCRG
ncbi:MAG: glycosyltransferase [Mogibacterium kristiansenii]|uniref:glycosyltransferase n=1 Tax=Mogibacterium kristiansenii TaxID=2606708 RepID=UPI00259B451F|nr:glycosyltransferase [uncultured Mogibacterium sp.]